jgi:subfamily B ATP-binding cassette protein HlyB/CyaB
MNRRESIDAAAGPDRPRLYRRSTGASGAFEPAFATIPAQPPPATHAPAGPITLRALVAPLKQLRTVLISIALATALTYTIELSLPIAFLVIIDSVIVNRASVTLDVIIAILALMIVFGGVLSFTSDRLLQVINRQLGSELSARFARHLLSLPVSSFKGLRGAELLSRLTELSRAHRLVLTAASTAWVDAAFICVCAALGLYFSLVLGLIMLARLPLHIVGSLIAVRRLQKSMRETQRGRREAGRLVFDIVDGIETIKARHAEDHVAGWVERKVVELSEAPDRTDFRALIGRYTSTIDLLITGAILWAGGYQVIAGTLTAGQLMAAYIVSRLMTRPIGSLSRMIYDFYMLKINVEESNRFLEQAPEFDREHVLRPAALEGQIRFEGVSFSFGAEHGRILRDASFEVRPGEVIGLVGPSGAGKTTILKLIMRLYLPAEGRVEIDGIDTATLDPHWLRERIGYVAQDCWVMGQTVAENIRLGLSGISNQDVVDAARLACAHEFISRLPRGYNTLIHGNSSMSVGERQRIAIARALVHRPKILLLDESTSGLDHETESRVVTNLRRVSQDKTVVIVAHRLSALRHASRILTLQNGSITETGSPDELIGAGAYFDRMVAEQASLLESLTRGRTADSEPRRPLSIEEVRR